MTLGEQAAQNARMLMERMEGVGISVTESFFEGMLRWLYSRTDNNNQSQPYK